MNERNLNIFKLLVSHFLPVPVLIFLGYIINNDHYLLLIIAQITLTIIYLAGYWEFTGMFYKHLYFVFVEILLIIAGIYRLTAISRPESDIVLLLLLSAICAYLLFILSGIFLVIFRSENESMEISFPFQYGDFLITDWGNSKTSRLMNYHYHSPTHKKRNTNRSMLFATDIVRLNNGAPVFFPVKNEDYPVFGDDLHSPMAGTAIKVINDIKDNLPFSGNYPYNTGNTVVIKNGNYYFLLGHIKEGSIIVKEGERVSEGSVIGKAGNSGMSERPHLHMQLMKSDTEDYWKGAGVSLRFKNKNLFKNRVIKI